MILKVEVQTLEVLLQLIVHWYRLRILLVRLMREIGLIIFLALIAGLVIILVKDFVLPLCDVISLLDFL